MLRTRCCAKFKEYKRQYKLAETDPPECVFADCEAPGCCVGKKVRRAAKLPDEEALATESETAELPGSKKRLEIAECDR